MVSLLILVRTLSLRYLRMHLGRMLLIVASIALGVATLVSTQILNQCLESAAVSTTTPIKGAANLYVASGEFGVPTELAERIRQVPGVDSVQPLVFERVTLPDLNQRDAILVGVDVSQVASQEAGTQLGVKVTLFGKLPRRFLPPVFLGRALFEQRTAAGVADDEPIRLRAAGNIVDLLPIGVVDLEGPAASLGQNVLAMEMNQASRVVGRAGRVNRMDVFVRSGEDVGVVRERLIEIVGDPRSVRTPEMQGQSTNEVVNGFKTGFLLCSAGAMVVGMFLVYNALSVSVAERRHDIGILRSLGATRGQIGRLFTIEAMILGLAGAACGVPLGLGLADLALKLVAEELRAIFLSGEINPVRLDWYLTSIAMLAGVTTALLASIIPAMQAASDSPADVVRRASLAGQGFYAMLHRLICATLVLGGLAAVLARDWLPPRMGSLIGLAVMLTGLLLATPIFVGWVAGLLRAPAKWLLGLELRIAADNLIRAPGRTGVVIGAFGAGVALMIQISGVGRSNEEPVMDWLERGVRADLFLFSGSLATANSSSSPIQANVIDSLRKQVPTLESAIPLRFARAELNEMVVYIVALDAMEYYDSTARRNTEPLPGLENFKRLTEPNTIVVSENFAVKHRVQVGDTVRLPGPDPRKPIEVTIVGTIVDYTWARGTIFMDRAAYAELFADPLVDICHVFLPLNATDAERASTADAVKRFASDNLLVVQDHDAVWKYVGDVVKRVYTFAYLQQFVVGAVASLGIVTALLISVLQRQRELGLLRAVGATRTQVLRMVIFEALLMGGIGTLFGIAIGIPLEWYVLDIVLYEESGFVYETLIPWREGLGIAAGAMIVSGIAGLIPAVNAMRLQITEAIAYE
ncbi:FtsX-like permease family protein [Tuwongella immobilis]|uniref:ABC3 transporter permease protein domain-containing protein n=1 Tax=Tuwongella immobilis TaxID=692036 RepID=A0A6C2YPS4_9BACT|nr:ABC transporter permease [Tuwongella immobilis]VIP03025.1 abc transporter permease : ABC transporter permease protein OS=Hyalangium minutum GN=DB31_2573 PE=4 SV=1: MacB_PCD: FtsX: MacB_PCD: FtsX [Tuwongella immobilis]VTS03163.1 abc transporter permease : ABC transporter permease protein OS=Hyalangium minutum GN=DB31_2573 PE=4 SV=1: MacB_PCD: FtsX: MacB_PCD: FtsX [Tuwongella immobilis]